MKSNSLQTSFMDERGNLFGSSTGMCLIGISPIEGKHSTKKSLLKQDSENRKTVNKTPVWAPIPFKKTTHLTSQNSRNTIKSQNSKFTLKAKMRKSLKFAHLPNNTQAKLPVYGPQSIFVN